MRDLRGKWVFPRLAYATSSQALDRNVRRATRTVFTRPRERVAQALAALDRHQTRLEAAATIAMALAEMMRAAAILLAAVGLLLLALTRL